MTAAVNCESRKPIGSQVIKKKFPPTLPPK